ncbi:hypothetical protein [Mycobacterium sp. PS03-16]|uniref:hypothetical protein n=1 Tax=Mycobacterium sp. PS03-16 TaxID=2559611 RepID=UPI001430615F|nr:hypothetical protein [Mycobacterium sp. PS03-16]
MSIQPEQLRDEVAALLADLPAPDSGDELAAGDIDMIAARLEEAHDLLVRALAAVEKG